MADFVSASGAIAVNAQTIAGFLLRRRKDESLAAIK